LHVRGSDNLISQISAGERIAWQNTKRFTLTPLKEQAARWSSAGVANMRPAKEIRAARETFRRGQQP